ncbi:MAG: riboflavin biosynthesis protein RibD [Flavobacterium sp. BFFFF1]|uniref:bifunctional diaminohydroxyphosphoribosylaminopyrimidine deaminase/5-amino-6-(5-phosphoribosylamino)uracil reductase RibD n=1 Tax=Flavobacterium sp. BFFFF1 TaxID=2015557 RepID=UPI000BC7F1EA|nr:bifunctional diaminohydroxyphosphoribosylaminopyrimidine deaminase/5-amino-6-(5-phosphoribosylamino)uracil reductase RibD [Flavobacterium sp. BFFFF1]OYU82118.1 MAG: riboflavin biosynthesis protein RibD [Flavobacterium sp. BFFFF1]
MKLHEKYIKRCIQLAKNGFGSTYPNPMVGCVIVHNGLIIGEGWHQKAGEPHAEVNAIRSVKDQTLLKESTIYVSLEPCSHFGKTPPCCDLIIAKDIPNIVVGTVDPFAKVAGEGIRRLKEAGKNVTLGVLQQECAELNKRFFTFHNKNRPYIILKWAETTDGFIAPESKLKQQPVWITNAFSRQMVHRWRSEEQAILIGTQTAIDDNPSLTTREWAGKNPLRIVVDSHGRIPKENHIFDNQAKTTVLSAAEINFEENIPAQIAECLFKNHIQSVIIEGGRQTIQTFIDSGMWDEARIFKGNKTFEKGLKSPVITGTIMSKQTILEDELLILTNDDQHNYF